MSLADDLLKQAAFLAQREPKRPAQASLRRAVSAAYYALFHLLTDDAAGMFTTEPRVFARLKRAYKHQDMKAASQDFSRRRFSSLLETCAPHVDVFEKLKLVADAFVSLQQARNEADYDVGPQYTRTQVLKHVHDAKAAFKVWREVRREGWARTYLGFLILRSKWEDEGGKMKKEGDLSKKESKTAATSAPSAAGAAR
jgi:hypothetical protein